MSVSDWSDENEGNDWDTLFLGDKVVPGVVSVRAKCPDPRDKKKGKGSKRATTGDDGEHNIEFDVTVTLSHEEAKDFQKDILPLIRKANKNSARDPLFVGHPLAYFWGVSNVTIGEVDTPSPNSMDDWVISFQMTEWTPEAKEVKPPKDEPVGTNNPGFVSNPPPTLAEQALSNSFG